MKRVVENNSYSILSDFLLLKRLGGSGQIKRVLVNSPVPGGNFMWGLSGCQEEAREFLSASGGAGIHNLQ